MKTRLTVDVDYNPDVTDPEGLAAAADRLMETICSTPGILDEYGGPIFGGFFVAGTTIGSFSLNIDGPEFRRQRALLLKLLARTQRLVPPTSSPDEKELLEGLINLTDAIADQAHDRYGVDCLLDETGRPCECELPGHFCCGVPGILAHLENGQLAPGAEVERCDLCQRYGSDEAALKKLREMGIGPS